MFNSTLRKTILLSMTSSCLQIIEEGFLFTISYSGAIVHMKTRFYKTLKNSGQIKKEQNGQGNKKYFDQVCNIYVVTVLYIVLNEDTRGIVTLINRKTKENAMTKNLMKKIVHKQKT